MSSYYRPARTASSEHDDDDFPFADSIVKVCKASSKAIRKAITKASNKATSKTSRKAMSSLPLLLALLLAYY